MVKFCGISIQPQYCVNLQYCINTGTPDINISLNKLEYCGNTVKRAQVHRYPRITLAEQTWIKSSELKNHPTLSR